MRRLIRGLLAAGILLLTSTAVRAQPAGPTYVLHNGKIFTADQERPWAEALGIEGDRISAVGANEEILALADSATELVDLGGKVVIPGINDAHVHVGANREGYGLQMGSMDPGYDALVDSMSAAVSRLPESTWITAAVGESVLDHPDARRRKLDEIAPDHPVLLMGWTGHGRILNSRALEELGISDRQPDPFGGWMEREEASRSLSGVLHGYAAFRTSALRTHGADSVGVAAFEDFARQAAGFGITSVQLMALAPGVDSSLRILERVETPVRWRIIHFQWEGLHPADVESLRTRERHPRENVMVSGVKWVLDGTPVERMMVTRTPFADRPSWRGRFYISDDAISEAVIETLRSDQQLLVHAVGDAAIERLLTIMESAADSTTWRAQRPRIEHGDGLMPDLYDRTRRMGLVVVQNPAHLTIRDVMQKRLRPDVLAAFQPLRSLLDAGIPIALGSDGPLNPYLNIMFAVTHPVNPPEALTREEAVTAYTAGSAFAEFQEHEKGALKPGMLADLAVLSQDIFTVSVDALPATSSLLTMIGGRIVHRDAEFAVGDGPGR